MLIKVSTIIGLPVFTIREGKKIKGIEDVIYHPRQNKIAAFLIESGGWFSDARVILIEDIIRLGEDAVLIDSADVIKKARDVEKDIAYIAKSDTYLTGTRIISDNGIELGKVSDIYFNPETGIVEEFEVSQQTNKNGKSEKKRIKISDIITIGEDATIVNIQKQENYRQQTVQQNLQQDETSARNQEEQTMIGTKNKSNERRKKEALGLYLTKNILTTDDRLLAREGEMVTNKLLNEAEEEAILEQVLDNISPRIPMAL